ANLNISAGAIFSVTNFLASTYTLDTAAISANGTGTVVGSTAATILADAAGVVDLATGAKGISLTIQPTSFNGDSTHPALYVSQFNNSDNVTFNSIGSTNPTVTLGATLSPGSVVVATSDNNSTFNGGQIAGAASLVKKSAGTLQLNQVNTYAGGTVVSNGTLQVGANNGIPSTAAGD